MVSSNNRTLLIFCAVLILLLILASICVIAGITLLSPMIEEQLSYLPVSINDTGGNIPGTTLAYISCPADNAVRAVDPSTKRVVATLRFEATPSLAIPCPNGDLYVAAGKSLYIVDVKNMKTLRNITYPGSVHRIAFSPDGSRAYVEYNDDDNADISVLSTSDYTSIGTIHDMPGSWGNGMVISPDGKYLYLTDYWNCELAIASLSNNSKIASVRCSGPDSYKYRETFEGHQYWNGGTACDIALSPDGKHVYVSLWSSDEIGVIDAERLTLEKTIHKKKLNSNSIAVSPDGNYLYVTNYDIYTNASSLTVIDAGGGVTLKDTPIAPDPKYMRITPDGRYLFICFGNDPVEVVNTKTLWVEGNLGFVGNSVEFSK